MPSDHPFAEQFIELLANTQAAYTARNAGSYLTSFAEDYYSVQLDHSFEEDKAQLAVKIHLDIERYEISQMDFGIKRTWFTTDTGFAHLAYLTRMRVKGSSHCIMDQRENLIIGRHVGEGQWEITCKVIMFAKTTLEQALAPAAS